VTRDQNILDYLQNRLSPADTDAFEQMMAQDAALAAEVDVMRSVRAELAAGPNHENADAVWDRISASIGAEAIPANDNRSPWQQVLKYAAVAVLAVGAWQVAVVPRISAVPDGFRAASETSDAVSLQVRFTETATLADISALLAPFEGRIIDGPSALGLVRLSFPDEQLGDAARAALDSNAALVEFVTD
jgi:anti-sigma factor RsiW